MVFSGRKAGSGTGHHSATRGSNPAWRWYPGFAFVIFGPPLGVVPTWSSVRIAPAPMARRHHNGEGFRGRFAFVFRLLFVLLFVLLSLSGSGMPPLTHMPTPRAPMASRSTTRFRGRFAFVMFVMLFRFVFLGFLERIWTRQRSTPKARRHYYGEGFRVRFAFGRLGPVLGFTREQVVQEFAFGRLEVEPGQEILDC